MQIGGPPLGLKTTAWLIEDNPRAAAEPTGAGGQKNGTLFQRDMSENLDSKKAFYKKWWFFVILAIVSYSIGKNDRSGTTGGTPESSQSAPTAPR